MQKNPSKEISTSLYPTFKIIFPESGVLTYMYSYISNRYFIYINPVLQLGIFINIIDHRSLWCPKTHAFLADVYIYIVLTQVL